MEKIAEKTVTEALAKAMESADRMKHVVIIYETVDEYADATHGVISNSGLTVAQLNFLADVAKEWCLENVR